MGRKKSNIKIKSIIGSTKLVSKKTNSNKNINPSLEEEVSSNTLPSEESSSRVSLIRSSNNVQVLPREVTTSQNEMKEDQSMFSQSRIYSSSSVQPVQQRTYVSAQEAARRFNPSIVESSQVSNPLRTNDLFENNDLNKSRGNSANRDYNKPLDLPQQEKKKRMPWEI